MSPVNGSSFGNHREQLVPIEFERARPPEGVPDHITLPPLLKPAPPGGSSTSRVALGTDFGVTFRMASPRPHPAPASCPKAKEQELSAGGGEDKKKVRPESVPRATRDVELPEPFKISHLPCENLGSCPQSMAAAWGLIVSSSRRLNLKGRVPPKAFPPT